MSSLKVAARRRAEDRALAREAESAWIPVTSPLDNEPVGDAGGVVSAINALQARYSRAVDESTQVESMPAYGNGDAVTTDLISEDMASRWDN